MLFYIELEDKTILIDTMIGAILEKDRIVIHGTICRNLVFKEDNSRELIVKHSDSEYQKIISIKIKNETLFSNKAKDLQSLKNICKKIV